MVEISNTSESETLPLRLISILRTNAIPSYTVCNFSMTEISITNESDSPTSRLLFVLSGNVMHTGLPWTIGYFSSLMIQVNSRDFHITCDPLKHDCDYMTSVSDFSAAYKTTSPSS